MSIKSIASSVIHFVKHAAVKVSDVFVSLVGHDVAAAFGHAALDVLRTAEGKIVSDAVIAIEAVTPALASADKKSQAFAKISADLKGIGKDVPNSLINMLMELAVAQLKGHFADANVKFNAGSQPKAE